MKKEELFEGAIVLARRTSTEKRSRCRILEVGDRCAKIRKGNCTFYTNIKEIQPAKITKKSLEECGFKEKKCVPCKNKCLVYRETSIKGIGILQKRLFLWQKDKDMLLVSWEPMRVNYMHEVQREIKNLKI